VVLSQEEVRRLLKTPKLLKHRVLIGLLYGCGLRCFEVRNVQLADLDFDRKQLHVRNGKGKKDRYVPLSDILIRGLKTYIEAEQPGTWLFNGKEQVMEGREYLCPKAKKTNEMEHNRGQILVRTAARPKQGSSKTQRPEPHWLRP